MIATMLDKVIYLNNYDELKILGNELVFQTRGRFLLKKYDLKINSIAKSFSINDDMIGYRKNIIIIGDTIDDTNMVANLEYENVIKIGFLNGTDSEKERAAYLKKYDMVIVNDGSFEVPN